MDNNWIFSRLQSFGQNVLLWGMWVITASRKQRVSSMKLNPVYSDNRLHFTDIRVHYYFSLLSFRVQQVNALKGSTINHLRGRGADFIGWIIFLRDPQEVFFLIQFTIYSWESFIQFSFLKGYLFLFVYLFFFLHHAIPKINGWSLSTPFRTVPPMVFYLQSCMVILYCRPSSEKNEAKVWHGGQKIKVRSDAWASF